MNTYLTTVALLLLALVGTQARLMPDPPPVRTKVWSA